MCCARRFFIMLFVAVAFSVAVWLVQSLRLIDLIVNRGLSVGLFLYLALLILPRFIDVVLPIAVFVAVLFVYNKLIAESELVVMRAAGDEPDRARARRRSSPALSAMAVLYALSLYLLPAANRAFKDLQFQIRNRFASVLVQDGVFNTLSDRLMIYDTAATTAGDLVGLLIYDLRDPQQAGHDLRRARRLRRHARRAAARAGQRHAPAARQAQRPSLGADASSATRSISRTSATPPAPRDRQPDERYTDRAALPRAAAGGRRRGARLLRRAQHAPARAARRRWRWRCCRSCACCPASSTGAARRGASCSPSGLAFAFEIVDIGLKNLAGRARRGDPAALSQRAGCRSPPPRGCCGATARRAGAPTCAPVGLRPRMSPWKDALPLHRARSSSAGAAACSWRC